MASVTSVENQFRSQLKTLGKATLNAIFPHDFNYYTLALELVDGSGKTVDYFMWPINPDQITDVSKELTRVKKTITGVSSLKNQTFNPTDITISGDFGKRFKIVLGGNPIEFAGITFNSRTLTEGLKGIAKRFVTEIPQFSSFAKTGYGCIKVLERIKEKSKQIDPVTNKPYQLWLYNPILGNNYLVEFISFNHTQSVAKNMISRYTIQMTAVAPLESIAGRLKSSALYRKVDRIFDTANSLASGVKKFI